MPKAPRSFGKVGYGIAWGVWRDRFVLCGGRGQRKGAVYDPAERFWEETPEVPFDVGVLSACAASGGCLRLWSAYKDAEPNGAVYDFHTRRWKRAASAPLPLSLAHAVGTKVAVWCGAAGPPAFPGTGLRGGAVSDMAGGTWAKRPDLRREVCYGLHPDW
jgi:hypothetical protein